MAAKKRRRSMNPTTNTTNSSSSVDFSSANSAAGDFSNFNQGEQQLNHEFNQLNFNKKAIEDDKWQ
jgi:hypothetical protein